MLGHHKWHRNHFSRRSWLLALNSYDLVSRDGADGRSELDYDGLMDLRRLLDEEGVDCLPLLSDFLLRDEDLVD